MSANPSLLPCDACGEGQLHPKTTWDDVEYKTQHGKIRHHYSVCDVCGSELANAQQMLENKRELIRFRKQVDNIPLGNQIAAMRKRLKLTIAQAGKLFGGGPVAFCKYEHDDILPDEAMSNLLYLAINHEDTIYRLAGRKNIFLPQSVQFDYVLEWFKGKEDEEYNALFIATESFDALKKSLHGKHVKTKGSPVEPVAAEMEFAFGNGWNGEHAWTVQ